MAIKFLIYLILLFSINDITMVNAQSDRENVKHMIVADSIQMAYKEYGSNGDVIIFIHGLGSNMKAWNKNIPYFANNYRCLTIDLPGYGKSSFGDYDYSMNFYAQTIAEFIEKLGFNKVHVAGHSMGGQIAITLALARPDLVQSLILIAPAGIETFSDQGKSWLMTIFNYQILKSLSDQQIIKNFEINFFQMPEDARFMIEDRFALKNTPAYDDYCKMIPKCITAMLDGPVFHRLGEIDKPTIVLYGNNDALIPNNFLHPHLSTSDIGNMAKNAFKNCELHMIDHAGHFLQWEKASQVNEIIKDFLTIQSK